MEAAARRWVQGRWNVAREDDTGSPERRVGNGDRGHEGFGVRVLRVGEAGVAICYFHDPAEVHDSNAVADVLDHAHVVRDEDVGQPELCLERLQQVQDLRLD